MIGQIKMKRVLINIKNYFVGIVYATFPFLKPKVKVCKAKTVAKKKVASKDTTKKVKKETTDKN